MTRGSPPGEDRAGGDGDGLRCPSPASGWMLTRDGRSAWRNASAAVAVWSGSAVRDPDIGDRPAAHNTVKTVALMRWLMRLVVPTAKATGGLPGVVLSTFMGSGTDGVAAISEGFRFVGMAAAIGDPAAAAEANKHTPVGGQMGLL